MESAYPDDASDTIQQIEDDFDLDIEVAGDAQENFADAEEDEQHEFNNEHQLYDVPNKNREFDFEDSPHGMKRLSINS